MMVNGFSRKDDPKLAVKPSPAKPYGLCRLYFKGLVNEDSLGECGIAICGEKDVVLFQMKTPILGSGVTELEAELTALKRGLTEALGLGITHISIYCDYEPIYRLITGRSVLEENKSGMLLRDVRHIRLKLASSYFFFVSSNDIRYVYTLARETTVYETRIQVDLPDPLAKSTQKTTCTICLDEDINADQMFYVDECRHGFCTECVRRHIEVRLLEQGIVRCPHYRCKSKLNLRRCTHLLTPKLNAIWVQRIREESIPVSKRIYCPNPKCSALMSKSTIEIGVRRCCVKCGEPFCIKCKVPWHSNMLCDHYKRLHPYPTENDGKLKALADERMWRQCGKCQHMIELSQGCISIKCRCGHEFCYQCGAEAGGCPHGHGVLIGIQRPPPVWLLILLFALFLGMTILWYFIGRTN